MPMSIFVLTFEYLGKRFVKSIVIIVLVCIFILSRKKAIKNL